MIFPGSACPLEGCGMSQNGVLSGLFLTSEAWYFIWQSAPWKKTKPVVSFSITKYSALPAGA